MHIIWLSSLALVFLTASRGAEAVSFPRAVSGNGYLAIPVGTIDRPRNQKRQSDIETILTNEDFFYATEITLGSPPQTVTVLVDTGSSELWVNPDCDTAATSRQEDRCESFGQYRPQDSETPPVGPFGSEEINYGDPSDPSTQTSVDLVYYADDLGWSTNSTSENNAVLTNQTFGVVRSSEGQAQGIFGLAPDLIAGFDPDEEPYTLVLTSMANQGLIASRVFSLDLRHSESQTGAIIYGGLDRSKFIGELTALPIIPGSRGEARLGVRLELMGTTDSDGDSDRYELDEDDTNVILDSGTSLTRLHATAMEPILDALDAEYYGEGYYVAECSLRRSGGSVDFWFTPDVRIRVPYTDFLLDIGDPEYCYVGVVETEEQQILGDSVLRAGYFVFDWDNQEIHVAQAADCGDSDIVAVSSGTAAVPNVTGQCSSSDAAFTTGGSAAPTRTTATRPPLPTEPITTVLTVSSCPPFDENCQTGVVTATVPAVSGTASATATAGGGGGSGGSDDDSAGAKTDIGGGVVLLLSGLVAIWNVFAM